MIHLRRLLPRVKRFWSDDLSAPSGRSLYQTKVRWGRLGLHIFERGDKDPDPHTHPWSFWTFPLTPYMEAVLDPVTGAWTYNEVRAFWPHYRPATYAHRLECALTWEGYGTRGRIITLVWYGKDTGNSWGFWVRNGDHSPDQPKFILIPWETYVGR